MPATRRSLSTLATERRSSPACWGSMAATSSSSGSATTASQTVRPMRPAAPKTPTRMGAVMPVAEAGAAGGSTPTGAEEAAGGPPGHRRHRWAAAPAPRGRAAPGASAGPAEPGPGRAAPGPARATGARAPAGRAARGAGRARAARAVPEVPAARAEAAVWAPVAGWGRWPRAGCGDRRGRRRGPGRGRRRGRRGRRGRRLLLGAQLAVLGLVGAELAEHPGDVGLGLGEPALVLGVGPGAELAEEAVGLALGRHVGHALLSRLGGLAERLLGLVQEAHLPSSPRWRS